MREAVTDAVDLDGRVLRTLRALASPGSLTLEFLRGRRAPYIGPLKLFFMAGAALSLTWVVTRGVDARYYSLPAQGGAAAYIDTVVRGLLASALVVAVISWLFSLAKRRFLDEAVFAVHLISALSIGAAATIWIGTLWKLAWGSVTRVPAWIPSLVYFLFLPAAVAALIYIARATRAVHGLRWWAAGAKALLTAAVTLFVVLRMITA